MMVDHVLVEMIRRKILLAALECHAAARNKPQQVTLAAAMRAIALADPFEIAFDFIGDLSTMTTA